MTSSLRATNVVCMIKLVLYLPGDVGGFMGLLLGGSAITIFELMDLIIYNVIRKCNKTRTGSQKPPGPPDHVSA